MKFDKKEAAGQPLSFSAPKNPQWVMLAALLLSYAAGYEYVDRCLGFGVGGADEDERYARLGDRGEGQSDSGAGEILVKL